MVLQRFLAFALGGTVLLAMAGCAALGLGGRDFAGLTSPVLQSPAAPRRGLEVTFFGTTTLLLSDGKDAILIDGFFSRPPVSKLLRITPDKDRIDAALNRGGIHRTDASPHEPAAAR